MDKPKSSARKKLTEPVPMFKRAKTPFTNAKLKYREKIFSDIPDELRSGFSPFPLRVCTPNSLRQSSPNYGNYPQPYANPLRIYTPKPSSRNFKVQGLSISPKSNRNSINYSSSRSMRPRSSFAFKYRVSSPVPTTDISLCSYPAKFYYKKERVL